MLEIERSVSLDTGVSAYVPTASIIGGVDQEGDPGAGVSALPGKGRLRFEVSQVPKSEAPGTPSFMVILTSSGIWGARPTL